ncbi:MAG: hypothetical protein ACMUJM_12675 [bacterium]
MPNNRYVMIPVVLFLGTLLSFAHGAEYTVERKKITIRECEINNISTTITIELDEDSGTYPYFDLNDPLLDSNTDTIIVQDPNNLCCADKKLTKDLLFGIGIFQLPAIILEEGHEPSRYVPLSFSFNPPLEINLALVQYYTCQYDDENEERNWMNINSSDEYLMGDRGTIMIDIYDFIEYEDGTINAGKGDANKNDAIITHMGSFIYLSDTSKGRCYISSVAKERH